MEEIIQDIETTFQTCVKEGLCKEDGFGLFYKIGFGKLVE